MPATVQRKHEVPIQKPNAVMLSMQELQWHKLTAVANNLSNASTPGFKSQIIRTEESVLKNKENKSVSFVKSGGIVRDLTDGPIKSTGNPLDVALTGRGYFMVATPSGLRYTRNGQFIISENSMLTTASGQAVLNQSGSEIAMPHDLKQISIAEDGTLSNQGVSFGKLGVVTFADENALASEGSTLYKTSQDPTPALQFRITQGAVEDSNISPIQESIRLMEILRLFENAQKVIDQYEDLQKKTLNASSRNA